MANHWFAYDGTGNPFLPASYSRAFVDPNCGGGCKICAIYLDDNSVGNPASLSAVNDYISNALITQVSQPVGAQIFTTLKNC